MNYNAIMKACTSVGMNLFFISMGTGTVLYVWNKIFGTNAEFVSLKLHTELPPLIYSKQKPSALCLACSLPDKCNCICLCDALLVHSCHNNNNNLIKMRADTLICTPQQNFSLSRLKATTWWKVVHCISWPITWIVPLTCQISDWLLKLSLIFVTEQGQIISSSSSLDLQPYGIKAPGTF